MRKSLTGINIATSLLQQAVAVICGFIVPKLILGAYGSAHNGIINSVSQFLSCVVLLRAGIGGVTRAALYKSLAANETDQTAAIIKATEQFMRKIALIFTVALVGFAALYPLLVKEEFGWLFSFSLVLVLGFSTIIQYYFGITNQFLLHADQRLYVSNLWQTAATILNTLLTVLLIRLGCGIHIAKLGSAAAFSLPPIMLYGYVRKKYALRRDIAPNFEAIRHRWDAFAHQVAAFVHSNTDIMVLTVFTDLKQVSVYSVYSLIIGGLNLLITTASSSVEALLGRAIARDDEKALANKVDAYEMLMHILATVMFGCAAMLVVPFVTVYTAGIHDVNYQQPMLGYLMCLAYLLSAIRLPYQNVIEAAGEFKRTKGFAITEAVLNLGLSCILVMLFGVVGVVLGTVIAMGYRTVCYAFFARKHMLHLPLAGLVKRTAVTAMSLAAVFVPFFVLKLDTYLQGCVSGYAQWVLAAIVSFACITVVTLAVNYLFYRQKLRSIANGLLMKSR